MKTDAIFQEDAILQELDSTTQDLLLVLSAFSQEQLNLLPPQGGWTAGQVAEHLIKASVVEILYGPVTSASRPPDQYIQGLRDQFLNFTIQMNSPEFVLPSQAVHHKETLLQTLEYIGTQTRKAAQSLDLSAMCLASPAPLGELTRLELIHFHLYHTQRHTRQLKNIYQRVIQPSEKQTSITI